MSKPKAARADNDLDIDDLLLGFRTVDNLEATASAFADRWSDKSPTVMLLRAIAGMLDSDMRSEATPDERKHIRDRLQGERAALASIYGPLSEAR